MSLNRKILIISLIILLAAPAGYFYYRKAHPKYVAVPRPEINITVVPGWNLRQIADDWVAKGLIKQPAELFSVVGFPLKDYTSSLSWVASGNYPLLLDKPAKISYEGYLFPDTYRVYRDSSLDEVLKKIFSNLENKITAEMKTEIVRQKKDFFEILTMASIVEKEAPDNENMAKIADIFWRRLDDGWPLQSCATVNYITGKSSPAVSSADKAVDSPYNTYKYRGLPPGPICNPSLNAIKAAIYPEKNSYVYFMSGSDGTIHYARTLEEHNANVAKYLR